MLIANDTAKTSHADPGPHEILAAPGHAAAAVGFGLALAVGSLASAPPEASLLWVRETAAIAETGDAYGLGLAAFGISPDRLVVAEMRTHADALRAALEGARCAALSAVVLETTGPVDLTASRRLKLAAEKSGVFAILVRPNARFVPNASPIRWLVEAASRTADPAVGAHTTFSVELLKHPRGLSGKRYIVEWNHEGHRFAETLPLPLAAVSPIGSLAA